MTEPDDSDRPDERRRRLLQAAGALTSLGLAGCGATEATTSTATSATPTTDTTTTGEPSPIQRRVADLSLREKAGQMTLVALNGQVEESKIQDLLADPGIGGVLYGAANPASFDAQTVAEQMNEYQTRAREGTDHGIPLLTGIDAVHGNATVSDAVVFPHNVGMGATWRPDLVRKRAEVTSRSMRAMGFNWNYAPVADTLYDPRWGRFYEGFNEFPSAVSKYVSACVTGMEADTEGTREVASSVKHFGGYAMSNAGNDRDNARIPRRDLRELIFPPFEAGIDAGAMTAMSNSGSVNGIPVHASSWLQQTVLRDELGFEGLLVSDMGDVWKLAKEHHYLNKGQITAGSKILVNAGIDMYMSDTYPQAFIDAVVEGVKNGDISEARVTDAVHRILETKEQLGLFADPLVDVDAVDARVVTDRDHELAQEAADASMTLLNQGALPLLAPEKVLVTGPNADDSKAQLGGWTLGWNGLSTETTPPTTTIIEGIRQYAPAETTVEHVPTGRAELSNRETVLDAATDADAVIAVLGERSYAEKRGDINTLGLSDGQRALLSALDTISAPTIGVLIAGRPRGQDHLFETTDGLLMAYLPGSKGGQAVGKCLFGKINPAGRLPFTWPASAGAAPTPMTKRGPLQEDDIRFLYGHGETFSDLITGSVLLNPPQIDPARTDQVTVDYTVTNNGDRQGVHLAGSLLYRVGTEPTTVPRRHISDWKRIVVSAGETRSVEITFPIDRLAVRDGDIGGSSEWAIPAGRLFVTIDGQQAEGEITETVPLSDRSG